MQAHPWLRPSCHRAPRRPCPGVPEHTRMCARAGAQPARMQVNVRGHGRGHGRVLQARRKLRKHRRRTRSPRRQGRLYVCVRACAYVRVYLHVRVSARVRASSCACTEPYRVEVRAFLPKATPVIWVLMFCGCSCVLSAVCFACGGSGRVKKKKTACKCSALGLVRKRPCQALSSRKRHDVKEKIKPRNHSNARKK